MKNALRKEDIHGQAAQWLVQLDSDDITEADREAFDAWLSESPEHERVYALQKQASDEMALLQHLAHLGDVEDEPQAPKQKWWQGLFGPVPVVAGLATACFVFLLLSGGSLRFWQTEEFLTTEVGEVRTASLPDGSIVTLGAGSALSYDFSGGERLIKLAYGEAMFEVEKAAGEPFIVQAGDAAIRVLGTSFDVHKGVDAVRVAVAEGRVEIMNEPAGAGEGKAVLSAGQQVLAPAAGSLMPVMALKNGDFAPWREGRHVYIDAYLRDVVADLNRYYAGDIVLADESLGALQFTASFRSGEIDELLETITWSLPLEVEKGASGKVMLRPKA